MKKTVRFIALGPSAVEAPPHTKGDGVEVWGIQYTWQHFTIDRGFVMDDEEWIVAKNSSFQMPKDIAKDMREAKVPIYVAKKWESVPNTIEYPITQILEHFRLPRPYFMNSMAYMFALAIFEGFERIETYGLDLRYFTDLGDEMHYEHNWLDETHCVAFWAGLAMGRGIEVVTTKRSSVMKPVYPGDPAMYGYEVSPYLKKAREEILNKRSNKKEQDVNVYRPPAGMSKEDFFKQIQTGTVKPIGNGKAEIWEPVGIPKDQIKNLGN